MKIFIVDDDEALRFELAGLLGDSGHDVHTFSCGEQLLTQLDDSPDLILLDIELPTMSGIEVCRAWRESAGETAQIIFISMLDDLEIRLAAYDAGGNDYIGKPIQAAELARKVKVAESIISRHHALSEQLDFAGKTAFTAISNMGELGVLQQFMKQAFTALSAQEVASALFDAVHAYGLECLLSIRLGQEGDLTLSQAGECSVFERSLLQHAETMGRLYQLHDRLVVNYPVITMLVSKMPLDDPDRVGRLRDHLALLVEAANTRLSVLNAERNKYAHNQGISKLLTTLADMLTDIQREQLAHRLRASEIHKRLLLDQVRASEAIRLSDSQERALFGVIEQAYQELLVLYDSESGVSTQLHSVIEQLQKIIELTQL